MLFGWNCWNSEKHAKIFLDLFWFEYTLQQWFVMLNALRFFCFRSFFRLTKYKISWMPSQLFVSVFGKSMIFFGDGFLKYISIKSHAYSCFVLRFCAPQSTYCPYNSTTITVLNCSRSLSKLFTFLSSSVHIKNGKMLFFWFSFFAHNVKGQNWTSSFIHIEWTTHMHTHDYR